MYTCECVFQDLQGDLADQSSNLEYINKTGEELNQKAENKQRAEKLKEDLKALNLRWSDISVAINQLVEKLDNTIEQLNQYQVLIVSS